MFRRYNFLLLIPLFKYYLIQMTFNGIAATVSYNVTRDECINANGLDIVQSSCCRISDLDDVTQICLSLHPNLSYGGDKISQFIQLSPLARCLYKKKKYIRSQNQLNMTAIKDEARRLYKNDTIQKNYMISMYKTCCEYATYNMDKLRSGKQGRELIKKTKYPYFMLVYSCTMKDSISNCPYFRWSGTTAETIAICKDYADECKKRFFENTAMYIRSLNDTLGI